MEKTELVAKSNRLVEASYRLTLNEQRIILYAICRSREEQTGISPNKPVVIKADVFAKQFPSTDKGHVYHQLREAMDALYDRSVTLYETDDETGEPQVTKTRWISRASYVDGAGRIKIVFTEDVIKYIHRLETEFTRYQLDKISGMSSAHAVRIYELLAQYKKAGKRNLPLKDLRNWLQIEPDEYKLTANFMRKVLDAAVKQINEHSDLTVSYKPIKTSRAITDFLFKIKDKQQQSDADNPPTDQAYRDQLEARGQQRIPEQDEQEEF